jgi:hypothetical protein
MRVPAEEVMHLFRKIRPGQLRRIPWLARTRITLARRSYECAPIVGPGRTGDVIYAVKGLLADAGRDALRRRSPRCVSWPRWSVWPTTSVI